MKYLSRKRFLGSAIWLLLCNCQQIQAQILPDTSLPSSSTVIKQGNINLIEGGTKAGSNLFHSFQEFSVPTGEIANFNNALDIQNIISRVTGKSISNIDGLIKANGTANFFLINPNGIIFEQNARLNIGGSFLASTANSFKFADGTEFSTSVPQTAPLLTVSVPLGLQYGNSPGSIQVLGSNLEVSNGKGITLVGGNINIDGGKLRVPGGHVELGSLAGEGNITLSTNTPQSLSFPQGVPRLDISIINQAEVNTLAPRGGSISINAQNLNVLGGSQILTGISDVGFSNSNAGDININATGKVTITGSKITNDVMEAGVGNAGDVNITASSLAVSDSNILTASFGQGSAGNVNINARDSVSFEGLGENPPVSGVFTKVAPNAVGNGGNIKIQAESLSLNNTVQMETNAYGQGNAGNIDINTNKLSVKKNSFLGASLNGVGSAAVLNINVSDSILFDDNSQLFASVTGEGKAGTINISTRSLSVNNNSFFAASANGVGNAGKININVSDSVLFDNNSKIYTDVTKNGRGGDINITAGSVSVLNNSQFIASTRGEGDAGNVNINAGSLSATANSFFAASANGVGNGGNININVSDFALFDTGAQLYTDVTGKGTGGNINIVAGSVTLRNGGQFVANTQGQGDAGNITINTGSLDTSNEAFITSSANGQGSAGNITINARGNVLLNSGSIFNNVGNNLFCNTVGSACRNVTIGNGGNITINAQSLNMINNSFLATGTGDNLQDQRTEGNAGNISIKLRDGFKLDKSYITSRVFSNAIGNGGQIDIQANSIFSSQSTIAASTQGRGSAGGVSLRAVDEISASNSDISTAVQKGAVGNAQGINITARSLSLTNGAQLNAVTSAEGKAGNIFINTTDQVSISGTNTIVIPTNIFKKDIPRSTSAPEFLDGVTSGVFTSTNTSGLGGDITVNTNTFNISDGAVMDARTTASGRGGTININANKIEAKSGGQITAITSADGTAGNINLNANKIAIFSGSDSTFQNRLAQFGTETDIYGKLKVSNQIENQQAPSGLFVSSTGTGLAGDLIVNANVIHLDNKAIFSADTKGGGGNINLNSEALIMRFGSNITTNATGINITGGNIILDTDVIAAFENSDITANSEDFRGGNIRINTQGIFGTQFREAPTTQSDITATGANSQLNGDVQINTPDIDPRSGLVELAVDVVDRSRLIAQGCPANRGNTFVVTGRGGVPSLPSELLRSDNPVNIGWVSLDQKPSAQTVANNSQLTQIVEATSWTTNEKGEVILTAATPVNTWDNSWLC